MVITADQSQGKKFLNVQKNIQKQKRLLLDNFPERYSNFKQDFPEVKTYFFKFCSLRPKGCITVGLSGAIQFEFLQYTRILNTSCLMLPN